uniref:Uncharacterized protein n=1 Tax=Rhipicephalus zambeziensis TaxID=60191 RepID=A0A224YFV2_9ACAR
MGGVLARPFSKHRAGSTPISRRSAMRIILIVQLGVGVAVVPVAAVVVAAAAAGRLPILRAWWTREGGRGFLRNGKAACTRWTRSLRRSPAKNPDACRRARKKWKVSRVQREEKCGMNKWRVKVLAAYTCTRHNVAEGCGETWKPLSGPNTGNCYATGGSYALKDGGAAREEENKDGRRRCGESPPKHAGDRRASVTIFARPASVSAA